MRIQQMMSVVTGVVMVAALAASPVASAAVDMFMKIDGIPGESKDTVHAGEIDVLAWSLGASKSIKPDCVRVQDMSFTKYVDAASPKLITSLGTGQVIPNAKLTVRRAGGTPLEYILVEMSNVIVSSLSTGGSGGEDRLTENVTLSFASMKFTYTPEPAGGVPGTPVVANIANTCR